MVILISAHIALALLDLQVADTKGQSVKDSTKKNLTNTPQCLPKVLWQVPNSLLSLWQHTVVPVRTTPHQTLKYPDSIGNYLSGIRTMLALIGNTAPDVKDRQMQMFLTGLKRTMDHTVQQASPIPPQLLVKMSKVVKLQRQNRRDRFGSHPS